VDDHVERIVAVLLARRDVLEQIAAWIVTDALEDEETHEWAEEVCLEAFGPRVECPVCGSLVLPTFQCWGCEEWVAP
jgi:hypothetical protein